MRSRGPAHAWETCSMRSHGPRTRVGDLVQAPALASAWPSRGCCGAVNSRWKISVSHSPPLPFKSINKSLFKKVYPERKLLEHIYMCNTRGTNGRPSALHGTHWGDCRTGLTGLPWRQLSWVLQQRPWAPFQGHHCHCFPWKQQQRNAGEILAFFYKGIKKCKSVQTLTKSQETD